MSQNRQFTHRFSPQARRALLLAQEAAQHFQQDHVDTEHLLLGLLHTPQSDAVKILHHMHIDAERVQQEVEALAQRGGAVTDEVSLTPLVKEAIKLAVQAANSLSDEFIGTEHLLLGLLSLDEGLAVAVLTSLGASLKHAHEIVLQGDNEEARQEKAAIDTSSASSAQEQPMDVPDSERQQQVNVYRYKINEFSFTYVTCIGILLGFLLLFLESFMHFILVMEEVSPLSVLSHIQPIPGWFPGQVLFFSVLIFAFLTLIFFPLYWYTGLVLPRRQGLVNMTVFGWLKLQSKARLTQAIPRLCFVEMIFFLMAVQPNIWWLWASLIASLYMVVMARVWPVLTFLRSFPITPLPSGELHQRLTALLERLHISLPGIFIREVSSRTSSANAYFTSWGRGRRVILTDTLLKQFTPDEIEVIVAHELGHMVHADVWKEMFIRALMMLGTLFLFSQLYSPISGWNLDDSFPFTMLLLFALYLVASYQYRTYQRRREYEADEFALQATGKVQAFKNAFTRLTSINMQMAKAPEYESLWSTHPDLVQRLQHADEFAARQRAVANVNPDSPRPASS